MINDVQKINEKKMRFLYPLAAIGAGDLVEINGLRLRRKSMKLKKRL